MTVINPIDDNQFGWAAWFNAFANAHGAGGIISGCSISKGTNDWDIDVTSGQIIESNTEASISSGTVTITDSSALSSGESRVTLIHADTGDALASTDGTAASNPTTPDIPAGEVLLGFVIVSNGDSTVADSDIFDIPALVQNDSTKYEDGGSHEMDASDFAGSSGTSEQLLFTTGSASQWGDIKPGSIDATSTGSIDVTNAIITSLIRLSVQGTDSNKTVGFTLTYNDSTTESLSETNTSNTAGYTRWETTDHFSNHPPKLIDTVTIDDADGNIQFSYVELNP